jgi:hypothetical protein
MTITILVLIAFYFICKRSKNNNLIIFLVILGCFKKLVIFFRLAFYLINFTYFFDFSKILQNKLPVISEKIHPEG